MGRKSGYYKGHWDTQKNLTLLRGWAMSGLTDKEISDKIGINRSTLYAWMNKYPEFGKALEVSKDYADTIAEQQLFKLVMGGSFPAIKYWLTCRKGKKWNENIVGSGESATEVNIIDDI